MTHLDSLATVRRLAAIAAMALSLAAPALAEAKRSVPNNFVGAMADGPFLFDAGSQADHELNVMVESGVESVRTVFAWDLAQPYRSWVDVPPTELGNYRDEGGVPTNWFYTDVHVANAVTRHLSLVPVVMNAPRWEKRDPSVFSSPPKGTRPYADFLAALTRRYGPNGAFWAEHPELPNRPLRHWQLWNEPSLRQFWADQPFAKDYVALLGAGHDAIKAVDPDATVVLAGLPNKSWTALGQIYKAGARGKFDIAAFHPFTAEVKGVKTILERGRKVLRQHGESRKPIWVTELSWTSAKGKTTDKFGNEATRKGQATKLTGAYRMLARERRRLRVQRVYWYTWLSLDKDKDYPFDYAGLSRWNGEKVLRKPAFWAFRTIALRLEGCAAKSGLADRCSG
jgi:hypothetical protein